MAVLDPSRVWIDGCFDFSHHGHAAAVLQAKRTVPQGEGCTLICGVHNDGDIQHHKGAKPVMHEQERYFHTESLRAVDEVVKDAPYVTEPPLLDQHGCMYVVHGDDITTDADGNDCYQIMKDIGRFRVVKRTVGVSTTDIIQRILTGTPAPDETPLSEIASLHLFATGVDGFSAWCWVFENSLESVIVKGGYPLKTNDFVYLEDAFDLFHAGHIGKLLKLRTIFPEKRIVAAVLKQEKDGSIAYMSYKERTLSLLSCKYVDAIIINPEPVVNKANLHAVVDINDQRLSCGQFNYLSKNTIIERISSNKTSYTARNLKKGIPPPISS